MQGNSRNLVQSIPSSNALPEQGTGPALAKYVPHAASAAPCFMASVVVQASLKREMTSRFGHLESETVQIALATAWASAIWTRACVTVWQVISKPAACWNRMSILHQNWQRKETRLWIHPSPCTHRMVWGQLHCAAAEAMHKCLPPQWLCATRGC